MTAPKYFKQQLVAAYDADAKRRSGLKDRNGWKADVRDSFVDRLICEGKKSILEIGAGAGTDSRFFASKSFGVLATDLSPKMVEACRAAGLTAAILDIYDTTSLNRKFDAVYCMNVLLHVPVKDLEQVLANIADTLENEGLFFWGTYGGVTKEEVTTDPTRMNLPRYFSFLDDETLMSIAEKYFEVVDYNIVDIGSEQDGLHFQALFLRKR